MVKSYSDNLHSIKNTKDLTMKQMFDYLRNWYPNNQTRSMEWIQLTGKILHGNIYLWLVVKKSSVSRTQRFTYFQILYYALERWTRTHNQIMQGKTGWCGLEVHQNTEHWTQLMVSQWNSSGISSQDSPHCSFPTKSQEFLSNMSTEPEDFIGRIIFMSMFNDMSWGSKENERDCELSAQLVFYVCKKIFIRKMLIPRTWIRKEVVFYSRIQKVDTQFSVLRVHFHEERSKAKVEEN